MKVYRVGLKVEIIGDKEEGSFIIDTVEMEDPNFDDSYEIDPDSFNVFRTEKEAIIEFLDMVDHMNDDDGISGIDDESLTKLNTQIEVVCSLAQEKYPELLIYDRV